MGELRMVYDLCCAERWPSDVNSSSSHQASIAPNALMTHISSSDGSPRDRML